MWLRRMPVLVRLLKVGSRCFMPVYQEETGGTCDGMADGTIVTIVTIVTYVSVGTSLFAVGLVVSLEYSSAVYCPRAGDAISPACSRRGSILRTLAWFSPVRLATAPGPSGLELSFNALRMACRSYERFAWPKRAFSGW